MKTLPTWLILIYIGLIGVSLVFTNLSSAEIDPETVIVAFLFDDVKAGDLVLDWSGKHNHGQVIDNVLYDDRPLGSAINFPFARFIHQQTPCIDLGKSLLSNLSAFTNVGRLNRNPDVPTGDGPHDDERFDGHRDAIERFNIGSNSAMPWA